MWAVEVVVVEPGVELLVAFERGLIGSGVGPFSESGLDEAFCLSVGSRRVDAGADVSQLESLTLSLEAIGDEAGPVVGHHAA